MLCISFYRLFVVLTHIVLKFSANMANKDSITITTIDQQLTVDRDLAKERRCCLERQLCVCCDKTRPCESNEITDS